MVLIYIRHSDDSRRDQEGKILHRDDLPLTRKGKLLARETCKKMIKEYGEPDIIYLSPFTRSKETLKEMLKHIKKKPTIYYDNRLSRYFSSREKLNPSCYTETFKHNIPIYENWSQFTRRVDKNLYSMYNKNFILNKNKVVWCITHALPFIQIAKVCKLSVPKVIPFMYYSRIRSHRIKYIRRYFNRY